MRKIPLAGRLPAPTRDDLQDDARAVYDAITTGPRAKFGVPPSVADAEGRLRGPFNAMVHASPAVGMALQSVGGGIRYGSALSDKLREFAMITVSAFRRSEFEWFVHAPLAAKAGVSDDALEAVARQDAGFFEAYPDAELSIGHRAVTELLQDRALSQDTWEKSCDLLGVRAVVDLVILVGYFETMALMLSAFRVALPDGAAEQF